MTAVQELASAMEKADRFVLNGKTQLFECSSCGWHTPAEFPIPVERLVEILGELEEKHPKCPEKSSIAQELLSIPETSAAYGIPEGTLRYWIHQGTITSYKLGRHRRIKRSDMDAYIEDCRED